MDITTLMIIVGIVITLLLLAVHLFTKSRQCLNFISTAWISLGILGTFVSIYVSLNGIVDSVNSIDNLIGSISPAFTTSIWGITIALFCQVIIKIYYSIVEKKEISRTPSSPEQCLYEIRQSVQSFESFIRGWNTMTDGFMKRLNEFYINLSKEEVQRSRGITANYTNSLAEIIKSSENTANTILKDALVSHVCKIDSLLNEELKKIEGITKEYNSTLSATAQSSTNAIQLIQAALIKQSEESSKQILKKVEEFETKMLMDKDNKISEQLKQFENQIKVLTEQWQNLMRIGTVEFKNALQKMGDYNASTLVELNNTCQKLKEICDQLTIQNSYLQNNLKKQ